ncbi:MAG: hypothetical protein IPF58_14090 [Saprospirales bacterium]|nr:hypothetical protein [Saprospirales bacterium]
MNKLLYSFSFLFFLTWNVVSTNAQTVKDIFTDETPITYLEIDFSNSKFYGDPGTVDGNEMVNLLKKINDVIVFEYAKKYNIAAAIKHSNIDLKIDLTDKLNVNIDGKKFITYNPGDINKLQEADINKIVGKYKTTGKGIGMIFIVDNMDKSQNSTTAWVTFFNLGNKKVLLTEKMTSKAAGFGFRNFWTKPFYDMIKDIKTTYYTKWNSKYN